MHDLTSAAEELEFEYFEPPRKRQVGEKVSLEVMKKAIEAFNTTKK